MTDNSRLTLRWAAAAVLAVVLVATGATAAYLLTRASQRPLAPPKVTSDEPAMPTSHSAGHGGPLSPGATAVAPGETLPDVTVTLTKEGVERAGIKLTAVSTGDAANAMRIPGVVEPNAYRHVVVTPIVAGRITRVLVGLGQHVGRGQTMAQIFSPELAEAQTKFISARAELAAHEQKLRRTEKLVEIGAASLQDLERIHAEHTAQTAEVQSARARLELLGVPPAALDSAVTGKLDASINVSAPISGVVTERLANVGLNVDLATKLFTVVDLSTVWVVADLYEKDFSRVRVGSLVTVTTAAYPDLAIQGRISYIDPQVSPETRTAKVRVEVPNARNELRLGMLAEVSVQGPGQASVPVIRRSAVQNVGDRQVVYLVNPKEPGKFVEREVRLGDAAGDKVPVLAGLKTGDVIVSDGSFYVRAERERLGLRPPPAATGVSKPSAASAQDALRVTVSEQGFQPARVAVRLGAPVRITFVRTSDATCAKEVAIPAFNLKRALPLNEPVTVEFTPRKTGDVEFVCGMGMLRGTIVVQ
jgi:membrane fusion protein, heavy metal efflux system